MSANLNEATVVFTLKIRKPGSSGKVNTGEVSVKAKFNEGGDEAEADSLRISKVLIKHPRYKEIVVLDSTLRAWLRAQALPVRLAGGRYLVPLALVERIDGYVLKKSEERRTLIRELVSEYPSIIEDARKRLGELFDAKDFPAAEAFESAFDLATSIEALADPGAGLSKFSRGLYEREMKKAQAAREKMVAEIQDGMRFAMAEFVRGLEEQLVPGEDGTRRKIMGAYFEKFRTFLDEFQARNVAGDAELESLVSKARALVAGADVEKLRASTTLRGEMAKSVVNIREALDGMTTSNGATLRASFVELEETAAPSAKTIDPKAGERAARLELEEVNAKAAPAPANPAKVRVMDLEEEAPKTPRKKAKPVLSESAKSRAAKLELE